LLLSPAVFELLGYKHIRFIRLSSQGPGTSSVVTIIGHTYTQVDISYSFSSATKSVFCNRCRANGPQTYWGHDIYLSFQSHVTSSVMWPFDSP